MPIARASVLALAAAFLAAPAAAAEDGPRFLRSYRTAVKVAKERGYPILVWCTMDGDSSCKADQDVFRSKEVQKAMTGYLVLYANPERDHGSREGTLDGKPAKVCSVVPAMTCDDHKAVIDHVYVTYPDVCVDKAANLRCPCHFVVDGDGKVLGTINNGTLAAGFDAVQARDMVKGLQTLLVKAGGPGLSDEKYEQFQKALASARTSVEQGRTSEGAKALRPLLDTGKNISLVQDARELLKRVDKDATAALAKAQATLKTDPVAGLAGLDRVAEDFPGTESAAAAAKAAEAFRGSAEGKKAVKDLAREKEGRAELEKAMEIAASRKDDARALRTLDALARKYEGLPCGAEAERRAGEIRGDPERMKALAASESEREARSELLAAKGLIDSGKKEEARKALQAILDGHPGTKGAEEAARLLEGLR
jgi:hypothetical protein